MRSPFPDPLKLEESSLQNTLGKREEFISSEPLYLLGSLHLNLKKTEEKSCLSPLPLEKMEEGMR